MIIGDTRCPQRMDGAADEIGDREWDASINGVPCRELEQPSTVYAPAVAISILRL